MSLGDADAAPMKIRGHGNTSWNWPNKPYKMKFDEKAALLGLPAGKTWILLANYVDRTLSGTRLAFVETFVPSLGRKRPQRSMPSVRR